MTLSYPSLWLRSIALCINTHIFFIQPLVGIQAASKVGRCFFKQDLAGAAGILELLTGCRKEMGSGRSQWVWAEPGSYRQEGVELMGRPKP